MLVLTAAAVALGVAYALELLRPRIRTSEDAAGVALLGSVPGFGKRYLAVVPHSRARRAGSRPAVILLIPTVLALKDLAKAVGCPEGGLARLARPGGRKRHGD